MRNAQDVVVVGAGLAGLVAARRLAERGLSVCVLERCDEVGGRQRSRTVDGFVLDRGFQLVNPAYPDLAAHADLDSLQLQRFLPGVLVRGTKGLSLLADPLRAPGCVPRMLRTAAGTGLLAPGPVTGLVRWLAPALAAPGRSKLSHDSALREAWDAVGLDGELRRAVLEPFFSGVLADPDLTTSQRFAQLLARMFVLGTPAVPAAGIRALPEQLAARARAAGVRFRLGRTVTEIEPMPGGVRMTVHGGPTVQARAAVVAVGPEAFGPLTGHGEVPSRGLTTWWFRAPGAPLERFLAVDGTRSGPLVHTAVMSAVAPMLSPDGTPLVQATALLAADADATVPDDLARRHAGRILGVDPSGWDLLARDDIPHALPVQQVPLRLRRPARIAPGLYAAGDHRDTASIQGAVVSGARVAKAVVEDLGLPR